MTAREPRTAAGEGLRDRLWAVYQEVDAALAAAPAPLPEKPLRAALEEMRIPESDAMTEYGRGWNDAIRLALADENAK